MTTIEVPVTTITVGRDKSYEWDCPHCGKRVRQGKHGAVAGCDHKSFLRARSFSDLVAVFSSGPQADPK